MAGLKDLARRLVSSSGSHEQARNRNERMNGEEDTMTRTTLNVEGMSCGHCKAAVEGEIGKLAGVESSEADFEKGAVEVFYDTDRVTTYDLRRAIEDAGYKTVG